MRKFILTCLVLVSSLFSHAQILTTSADKIIDHEGNEVQLRGVNLGTWFLIEPYMISEGEAKAQWQIKRKMIAKGATAEEVERFFATWHDLFIQRGDIDHIASLGLNNVRLPLHYELFLTAHQRAVHDAIIVDSSKYGAFIDSLKKWQSDNQLFTDLGVEGFRRIDSILLWSRPHGIYVTIDLHAAPGGQGNQLAINDAFLSNQFWKGRHAKLFQSLTTLLWKNISARYKNDETVAMYDMLNEPNHIIYIPRLRKFYKKTLEAIRSNGDQHLALIEGGLWGSTYMLTRPQFFRRHKINNIVYNVHDYSGWRQPKNKRQAGLLKARQNVVPFILTDELTACRFRKKNQVPVYVGEFGEMGADWVAKKILTYDSLKLSWAFWSYKKIEYHDGHCGSGLSCTEPIDFYSREGREKCLAALREKKFILSQEYINAMKGKPTIYRP